MYTEIDYNNLKDKIKKLCDDNKIGLSIDYENIDMSYQTLNKIFRYLDTSINVFKNRKLYKTYINMEKIYTYIGDILSKTNQKELANKLNISQSLLSKMENNNHRLLRIPTFNKICETLSLNKYDYIKETLRESIQLNMKININPIKQNITMDDIEHQFNINSNIDKNIHHKILNLLQTIDDMTKNNIDFDLEFIIKIK